MSVPFILSDVPDVTPYIQYVATGGQTVFPYPFPITQDSDLVVVANGVTLNTDSGYTLSGQGNDNGGNVTFTLGRTAGDIITLFRDIQIQRVSQIAQNSGFSSTTFNAEFNNIYLIMQQLAASQSLSLQVPNTNNPSPVTTLTPSAYANKYLAFDANGNPQPAILTSSGSLLAYQIFARGNQTPVAGSAMQIDSLLESTPGGFNLQNEAGIWAQTTYTFAGFSKEFTSTTVSGAGASPLTTLFAFANNNGSPGDVVAFIGDAVARTNSGTVFAANLIARNGSGVTGAKLVGLEIDIEPAPGTTIAGTGGGLFFNIFSIAAPIPACLVGGVGGGTWQDGFITSFITGSHHAVNAGDPTTSQSFINTLNGTFSQTAVVLGQGINQGVQFGGLNFGISPYIYGDSSNNLMALMGSTDAFIIQDHTGADAHVFTLHSLGVAKNNAVPIGGSQLLGVTLTSVANLGLYIGSGAPSMSAAQGSLYMRTDGSSGSTRLYVNTNGTTGWTNVTTAA